MVSGSIHSSQIDGEKMESDTFYFLQDGDWRHEIKDPCSLEEKLWQTSHHIKKQWHHFANKGPSSQGYGFSSGHV